VVAEDERSGPLVLKSDAARRVLDGKRFAEFVVCCRYWSIDLRAVKSPGTILSTATSPLPARRSSE
jgi:hypothetical protein